MSNPLKINEVNFIFTYLGRKMNCKCGLIRRQFTEREACVQKNN